MLFDYFIIIRFKHSIIIVKQFFLHYFSATRTTKTASERAKAYRERQKLQQAGKFKTDEAQRLKDYRHQLQINKLLSMTSHEHPPRYFFFDMSIKPH